MTIAAIEYTSADQMLADYAARRRVFFDKPNLVVLPQTAPAPEPTEVSNTPPLPIPLGGRRRDGLRFTEQECEILLEMAEEGFSARAIATKLRRSPDRIVAKGRQMGIIVHMRPKRHYVTPLRGEAVTALYKLVVDQDRSSKARVRGIIGVCADNNRVTVEDVLGLARSKPIVMARQQAMWLAAKETALSLAELGRQFSRDHTTVIHAVRRENTRTGENVRNLGGTR